MTDSLEALILDFLLWVGPETRPYDEALEAWRTSCPALPVWEEAHDRGLVDHVRADDGAKALKISALGHEYLEAMRPTRSN